ncbi:MAG TPA: MFS transporter [Acidimicrobiales bacterium]|nr:MFS transporter [Acidimicrobiales bacterium]
MTDVGPGPPTVPGRRPAWPAGDGEATRQLPPSPFEPAPVQAAPVQKGPAQQGPAQQGPAQQGPAGQGPPAGPGGDADPTQLLPPGERGEEPQEAAASPEAAEHAQTIGDQAGAVSRRLAPVLGGLHRARVIGVLAAVLALSSADTATVGSAATELRNSLHITNTDIGLLVAVTSVVGAVFSLPFGVLADRVRRTWLLGGAVATWGAAMVWSATAAHFSDLLLSRLALGAVSAAAGPTVASLVGDWFRSSERGRIYSYVLTGELLGAGAGFALTGEVAALSWRAAFLVLAVPALALAAAVLRLPEPVRGGRGVLLPDPGTRPWREAQARAQAGEPDSLGAMVVTPEDQGEGPSLAASMDAARQRASQFDSDDGSARSQMTDAQRLAMDKGIAPDPELLAKARRGMGFVEAVKYVMAVRTNVALIVSGACGYYFLAGIETFGVEFVSGQYRISVVVANLLLIVVGGGAAIGILVAGPTGDRLLRRGHLRSRPMVAAVFATLALGFLIPALLTRNALTALPFIAVAAAGLSGQNPPIDAARLDIVPAWLWGRAEGVRTFVRTAAQALAPLLFGAFSEYLFGGGTQGLYWTFVVMLVPLSASALYLYFAAHRYPVDVATAGAAQPVLGEPWSPDE